MRKYTREQLLFYMKKCAKEHGKTPTIKDMNDVKDYPSATTFMKRFGSSNRALKEAGLTLNAKAEYSKQELIESLRQLNKEIGKVPKVSDIKEWMASYSTYRKQFGTWDKALSEAGIHRSEVSLRKFIRK